MKINVVMPQLGESVTEGEVLRWLKRAGEPVQRDEALVEVKTDKATVEIPAPASGTLSEILVPEGGKVAVGTGIATLESTSEAAALAVEGASTRPRRVEPPVARPKAAPAKPAAAPEPVAEEPGPKPSAPPERTAAQPAARPAGKPAATGQYAPRTILSAPREALPKMRSYSSRGSSPRHQQQNLGSACAPLSMTPLARRVAAELGVDPSKLKGTGEGGRITREDVLRAAPKSQEISPREPAAATEAPAPAEAAEPAAEPEATPAPHPEKARAAESAAEPAPAAKESAATPAGSEDEVVALSPIRRRIAARLVQSSQTIPHVTTAVEADMTPLAELRKRHRESYEQAGIKLSYMPFILMASVGALKEFPAVNASWGGDKLILHRRVHLGVAVSIAGGLVVPVIRNADSMSLLQLAQRLAEVAEHARAGKLAAGEIQGGTFTVTNPGLFGTVFSTPIINPPEAAILAVCRIAEAPVVWNGPFDVALRQAQGHEQGRMAQGRPEGTRMGGQVAVRLMTRLCLSYDHRIIDGETAIKFLQHMRASLEAAKFDMD